MYYGVSQLNCRYVNGMPQSPKIVQENAKCTGCLRKVATALLDAESETKVSVPVTVADSKSMSDRFVELGPEQQPRGNRVVLADASDAVGKV